MTAIELRTERRWQDLRDNGGIDAEIEEDPPRYHAVNGVEQHGRKLDLILGHGKGRRIANRLQVGESRDMNSFGNTVAAGEGGAQRRTPGPRGFWALLLVLALLGDVARAAEGKKLRVVTTILPVYCFASGVIGEQGTVENLLPANVGPHDYQLSPSDLRKLKEADLVIFNGLGLDNWVLKAVGNAGSARAVELGKLFKGEIIESGADHLDTADHKHGHDHHHGPGNPHVWLDPQLAMRCVTNILAAAQKANPAAAADYARNAEAFLAKLKKLDADIAEKLAPVKEKPFITQHDAFPYFIRRYQLKLAGVVETTPDVSPSPRYLADLLRVIRDKKVPVIFNDAMGSARLSRQVARDAKIRTAELDTLERGKLQASAYEEGMRRNAETLARELK